MNNKKLINDRKEILRQHLLELHRTNWIRESDLIRDNVYYARDVFPQLIKKGYIAPHGTLIHYFDIDAFIDGLYLCRTKEPIKAIGKKSAKSIGQKMSKSIIDLKEIIKHNETQPKVEIKMPRLIDQYTDQELKDELTARGWHGELMKTMQ